MGEISEIFYQITVWTPVVLLAVPLHEAAHGFAAMAFGDDTARRMGRLSLNPARHVDPFGTLILPAMLLLASGGKFVFGWAKPVPVDFGRLRPFRAGMVVTALAGPATNIVLAVLSALLIRYSLPALPLDWHDWWLDVLYASLQLNLVLAVFNMIPLPPLDGGRVAVGVLPRVLAIPLARTERWGILVLLGVLFLLPMVGIEVMPWLLDPPIRWLGTAIVRLTGI